MASNKLLIQQIIDIVDDDEEEYRAFMELTDAVVADTEKEKKRKRKNSIINRDKALGYSRIFYDYLSETPRYPERLFRRRFRMSSRLFRRLWTEIPEVDLYFTPMKDALGREGVSPLQKIVAALRMLTYGESADRQDEYAQIGESTARKAFLSFCKAVVKKYKNTYLREPNDVDLRRILQVNTIRGFPGMIGREHIII